MDGPARRSDAGREYFRIGEVAKALDITPSAIRFYLSRFAPYIRPTRSKTHRQLFSRRDVQVLKVISILRREYGLSVRDTLERLQDLLDTYDRDPFAIERTLVSRKPQIQTTSNQGALPLDSPSGTSGGVREPGPETGITEAARVIEALKRELAEARRVTEEQSARIRSLEQELEVTRLTLNGRDDDLAQARRTVEELCARIRDIERSLRRVEIERNSLREQIAQAVCELLLEVRSAEP